MDKRIYMLDNRIDINTAYSLYEDEIKNNPKYDKCYNKANLTVDEMYIAYYFFDAKIDNLSYFYINKDTNEKYNGQIDVSCILSDSSFILNNLNKSNFKRIDDIDLNIYNKRDYEKSYKLLIDKIKDKALYNITNKHSLKRNKNMHIDVAPIDGINNLILEIYYERIYVFRYRYSSFKRDYISILSDYNKSFYSFEYNKSLDFINYLKRYRMPIEAIPKEYLDLYYNKSFNIYLNTLKRLEYESSRILQKKIKDNIDYEEYSLYYDYLLTGIFYYKNKRYLKRINTKSDMLNERILLSFLTLRHQAGSGLFLYECAKLNLLADSSLKKQLYFLDKSFKLGSLEAKKILYDHYNEPMYYDEELINRYS